MGKNRQFSDNLLAEQAGCVSLKRQLSKVFLAQISGAKFWRAVLARLRKISSSGAPEEFAHSSKRRIFFDFELDVLSAKSEEMAPSKTIIFCVPQLYITGCGTGVFHGGLRSCPIYNNINSNSN